MHIDIHRAKELKVRVKDFSGSKVPFVILKLRTDKDGRVSLFFDSMDDILRFACNIINKTCAEEERVAKESP